MTGRCQGQDGLEPWSCSIKGVLATVGPYAIARNRRGEEQVAARLCCLLLQSQQDNVLLIMTDDVGFGAPSTFGGVIPTPNLDRVGKMGLRYTKFHSGRRTMNRFCVPLALLVTGVLTCAALADETEEEVIEPVKKWKGEVADVKLKKDAPQVITSQKVLEKLWKGWKVKGKVPVVDFKNEFVFVATGDGSKLDLYLGLDGGGNLHAGGAATRDLAEGFRFVIATISRKRIKTVNFKELPK